MQQKEAYIFIGQSGCGKGTQAALLEKKIHTLYPDEPILHIETGDTFRTFITTDSYTAQKTKVMMEDGKLPPSFIGIHVWSHEMIAKYVGQRFLLLDGTPRIAAEVPVLLSAAKFYEWKLHVIYLEVSDAWANDRLIARGRADDQSAHDRAERISWFHVNVMPVIQLFQGVLEVDFLLANGERPIAEIHTDICEKLKL